MNNASTAPAVSRTSVRTTEVKLNRSKQPVQRRPTAYTSEINSSRSVQIVQPSPPIRESVKVKRKIHYIIITVIDYTVVAQTRARANYDCNADQGDELTFTKNQIFFDVKQSENEGWFNASMYVLLCVFIFLI